MIRVIRSSGLGVECVEDGRSLFRRGFGGAIEDAAGKRRITCTGESWNCVTYEFADDTPYPAYPPEPRLRWRPGLLGILPERIESDGFSGTLRRERVLDQVMFQLGAIEWRFDASQHELYFEPPEPRIELRATLLAFVFFNRCIGG